MNNIRNSVKDKIRFILVMLLTHLLASQLYSQSVTNTISLVKQHGYYPLNKAIRPTFSDSASIAKKIPENIADFIIKHFSIGNSKITETSYYFLIGNNNKGDRVLIYDKNGDLDFTNDSIINYRGVNSTTTDTSLKINLVYHGYEPRVFTIKPVFESKNFTYNTQAAQDKFLMISVYEHFNADFIFDNRTYSIYVSNKRVSPYFENDNGTFILMQSSDTTVVLKIGTPAKIDDLIVEPVFISEYADILKLYISDTLQSRNISGTNVGFKFPDMNLTDVKDKQLHLPIKGKYNLLDFWGTWCAPCKALTPDLKQISDKQNTMLEIISIAFDDDTNNLIKYIDKNAMNWHHCIANKRNSNIQIIEICDLASYPTFILLNPEGIVIGRYVGMVGFQNIKLKLEELGL